LTVQRDLQLVGPQLDLDAAQLDPHPFQRLADAPGGGLDLVAEVFAQQLVALVDRLDRGRRGAAADPVVVGEMRSPPVEVELDLQPRDVGEPGDARAVQRRAEHAAAAERHLLTVAEPQVTEDPRGVLGPGHEVERRGVRHHHHVGRARHLGHAEAAVGVEGREHRRAGRVLRQQRRHTAQPTAERGGQPARRDRLAVQDPVLVHKGHPDRPQALRADPRQDGSRRFLLLLGPEPELLDEPHASVPRAVVGVG
jgi:hypothetical protein